MKLGFSFRHTDSKSENWRAASPAIFIVFFLNVRGRRTQTLRHAVVEKQFRTAVRADSAEIRLPKSSSETVFRNQCPMNVLVQNATESEIVLLWRHDALDILRVPILAASRGTQATTLPAGWVWRNFVLPGCLLQLYSTSRPGSRVLMLTRSWPGLLLVQLQRLSDSEASVISAASTTETTTGFCFSRLGTIHPVCVVIRRERLRVDHCSSFFETVSCETLPGCDCGDE